MRIQRILVAALLGFAAMSPTLSEPAQATTIAPLTTEQMTDASTYIVEGTITRVWVEDCLLYTSPSPRDQRGSRMPSSA